MSKRTVAVRIAGNEYKIRSEAGDDALHQLAEYVDRAMQRVRDGTGTVDSLDVAVLTCLNLAREILGLKEQRVGGVSDAALRALIDRVEGGLSSGEQDDQHASQNESVDGGSSKVAPAPNDAADSGASESSETTAQTSRSPGRTLDLPSVESLRERGSEAEELSQNEVEDSIPQTRMAAGGRERAS